MARGDSILSPISLDDSDDKPQPQTIRLPTVRRRERPRIDQDGIEIQEQQTEWQQAAAQRDRRREMVLRALNRAPTHASGSRNTGTPRERARERSPSAKATCVIELTDEDEPEVLVPQQPATAQDLQSALSEAKISPRDSGMSSSLNLPESSTQVVSANIGLPLPVVQAAAPLLAPAPRQSTPSASDTPGQIPEPVKIAQATPVRTEVVAATHMMPRDDTPSAASVRDSESTLLIPIAPIPHVPSEPTQTKEITQIAPDQPDENAPSAAVTEPGKPTLNNGTFDSLPPIGGPPDDNRERATSSRVNTSPERGGTPKVNNINADTSEPTNACESQATGSELAPTERKVIKSVKRASSATRSNMGVTSSRLPDSSPDEDLTNEPFLAHVHDDHAQAPLRQRSRSQSRDPLVCSSSNIAHAEFSLIERGENNGSAPEQPSEILQEEGGSEGVSHTSHPPSDTSAQRSVEPPVEVSPDNLLPDNTKSADDGVTDDQADNQVKLAVANFAEDDLEATRSAIDTCLKRHIAGRHETHAYLTWSRMMRQRTYQEQELRARSRKQKRLVHSSLPERYEQQLSPFADMHTIQLPFKSSNTKRNPDMSQEIFVKAKPKDIVMKSALAAPTTKYKSNAVTIPPFKEYVSLENNILADNESKLLATPYFQDEDYTCRETLLSTLPYIYELTHDENGPLDLRKEQCRFYKDTIEAFLHEIGVSWNEILYWLLAPEQAIARISNTLPASASFRATLFDRSRYHTEEFERDGQPKKATLFDRSDKKWRKFLSQLGEPKPKAIRIAAIACTAVFQECGFSIWYLAQRSEVMQDHIMRKTAKGQTAETFTYRHAMCRVCYQHNCLLHGELREVPEDSWKTDSDDDERLTHVTDEASRQGSVDKPSRRRSQINEDDDVDDEQEDDGVPLPAHFHDDSDIEKVINYKLPVNPDAFAVCPESEMIACKGAKPPSGKFNSNWWLQQEITSHWEKRKPFFPCNHHGSCENAKCRCYREGINCEKTCKCSQSCNRRYPGCTCSRGPVKRACVSSACLCVKFNRECDADLCGSCGATEVLDPVNRYDEHLAKKSCGNVAIQRGVPRKTLLGRSEVHGFGLYMGEDIKSGEYIGEYTGEAISVNEGDRRVTIYDYQKTMYLFRLNSKQEVDATYMGNKLRFINNADDKYTNCFPKNMLCNTVFRIALFAITDIKAGTELYFNYNYPKEKTAQFKQPGGKADDAKQTKSKTKKRESLASLSQSIEDRSRTLAATAKARAAKAAKQAARRREEESTEPTSRLRSGPLQARKTAPGKPGRKKVTKARGKGKNKSESTESDADMRSEASGEENALVGPQDSQATSEVRDTDMEDEEFFLRDSQEDVNQTTSDAEDAEDTATEYVEDTLPGRRSSRTRNRLSNITPVVAVKKKKGKARPVAGKKKRKRPVVANSDDE